MDLLPGRRSLPDAARPDADERSVSPYKRQFSNVAGGLVQALRGDVSRAATGSVTINYPVATYDIRSTETAEQLPPGSQQPIML